MGRRVWEETGPHCCTSKQHARAKPTSFEPNRAAMRANCSSWVPLEQSRARFEAAHDPKRSPHLAGQERRTTGVDSRA